ncbi:MAG: lytic transglycosylase domain-containing protein [Candidatus Moranbacteria bacterium]|nr:lytic transglycosylase domain-containing protein [Candidatus Moranbacteria bacterium]
MKNKKTIFLAAAIFFISIFILRPVFSAEVNLYSNQQMIPGATSRTCDVSTYIQQIIGFGYATIGILTMFMLGIGAFQYIMSIGNTARMTSAKNTVNYAILGLVLGLLSWIILYTINPNLVKVSLGETVPCTIQWGSTGTGTTITGTTTGKYDAISLKNSIRDRINSYNDIIKEASEKYGVPEYMIKAVIYQESRGVYDATGPMTKYGQAVGLMQLIPSTASGLGVANSKDPYQNIMGGTKYLSQLYNNEKYGNKNWERTLIAYNWGEGNLTKKYDNGSALPAETAKYVPSVLGLAESFKK